MNSPPKLPLRLLRWFCHPGLVEDIEGDLLELYDQRATTSGKIKARWLYAWDVVKLFRPGIVRNFNGQTQINNYGMFNNFLTTAWRNLTRHVGYFTVNALGLAIGMASFIFISMYLYHELSYDRFHSQHSSIYRVSNDAVIRGERNHQATTSVPMAGELLANFPEIKKATRIAKEQSMLIGTAGKQIIEENILFSDSSFFEVFDFKLLHGNPKTALRNPNSMVLSESYARKYFGDIVPLGQTLTSDNGQTEYIITGVVQDTPPNSHIKFDMVGSINSHKKWNGSNWVGSGVHTYVLLGDQASVRELEERSLDIFYAKMAPQIEYYTGLKIAEWMAAGNSVFYRFTPIADIHLKSDALGELEPGGNYTYMMIYGLIGCIILVIAIFNFVNLATAHSSTRAREVGVRKVIGSTKKWLVYQFLIESVLVSVVSTVIACAVVTILTSSFEELVGHRLGFTLYSSYWNILILLGLSIFIGVLAGFYPAFVMSGFRPLGMIKERAFGKRSSPWLRDVLVTMQFASSIIIILAVMVVYSQLSFMREKHLGFDKEQVLVLGRPDWLGDKVEVLKTEMLKDPNVMSVSTSKTVPGKSYSIRSYRKKDNPETFLFLNNQVDYDHMDLLGLELTAGRFFSKEFSADSNAVIINEAAALALGFEHPVGQPMTSAFKKGRILRIIGVVKNYNFESLHKSVAPLTLELSESNDSRYFGLKMKNNQSVTSTTDRLAALWESYTGDKPMIYFFLDEEYQKLYSSEVSTSKILLLFAFLAVFIAVMGIVGLMTYMTNTKQKEIGVRKVLGASSISIIRLLSINVLKLLLISVIFSWPLAYVLSIYWLENFAVRIAISPWWYIGATLMVVLIVCTAILSRTRQAALANPVDAIRNE